MNERLEELFGEFTGNHSASPENLTLLDQYFAKFGKEVPDDLRDILEASDSAEGFVNENHLMLWAIRELLEYNRTTQVDLSAPGLILFGSDGGGETYALDSRGSGLPVIKVPAIGMSLKEAILQAPTFTEFLEKLAL
jgi:hypothetical protein